MIYIIVQQIMSLEQTAGAGNWWLEGDWTGVSAVIDVTATAAEHTAEDAGDDEDDHHDDSCLDTPPLADDDQL